MNGELLKTTVGQKLRNARKSRGITQEALAELTSLKRTSITNIEKGRQSISLPALYSLAEALDVEPHDLLPTRKYLYEASMTDLKIGSDGGKERTEILNWVESLTSNDN